MAANQQLLAQNQQLMERLRLLEAQMAAQPPENIPQQQPEHVLAEVNSIRNVKIPPFWR